MSGAPRGRTRPSRAAVSPLALLLIIFLLAITTACPTEAQDDFVPEIPLTSRFGIGARSLGMGGTGIAAADDLAALHLNPAALALVRRTEGTLIMADRRLEVDAAVDDLARTSELTKLRFNAFGFVYPFKTYRGSLVLSAAISRPRVLDVDIRRSLPGNGSEFEFERGGPIDWRIGLGIMVSPTVTLGGSIALLSGDDDRTFTQTVGDTTVTLRDESSLSGWTGSLGALVASGDHLRFGVVLHFPENYDFEGTHSERVSGGGSDSEVTTPFKDEVDLPFSFGAGAALTLPGLILTGDFRRTDWREIDFAGLLRFRGEDAYRATTSWHLGGEWYLPWAPIRLRAGYQDDPLPYLMLPDFTGVDPLVFAEIDDDRSFWSIGAGFLVSDHLTADLALMRGDFRRSTEVYVEEVEESRLLVSVGYRN